MMELNIIATGIELLGTVVKELKINNSITEIGSEAKRSFGLEVIEPEYELNDIEGKIYASNAIKLELLIQQNNQTCEICMVLEGGFCSHGEIVEQEFYQLVKYNGVAALIGIARGKIESITGNIFNDGKIVIPFVNVVEYYKEAGR